MNLNLILSATLFYFTIPIFFITQNVNAIEMKDIKHLSNLILSRNDCIKSSPIKNAIQHLAGKTDASKIGQKIVKNDMVTEKQIEQKINSEKKRNVWNRIFDLSRNLWKNSQPNNSRKKALIEGEENRSPKNVAQISKMRNYYLPTGICPDGETSLAPAEDDNINKEEKRRQESMVEKVKSKIANSRIQQITQIYINLLEQKSKQTRENAEKGGKILRKIFGEKRKTQFAKKLIELHKREKTIQELCHPNSIQLLGRPSNGPKTEYGEKNSLDNRQQKNKSMENMKVKKDEWGGQIGENDRSNLEERTKEISYKSAIRFALRVYFCNHLKKKEGNNSDNNEWKSIGQFGLKEWIEHKLDNVPVKRMEKWFERSNPIYPHEYKVDFKFTLFFPDEFALLWTKFGLEAENLLISLTNMNLDGFENPAKSKSWMATSWDKQMFLKTIQIVPKNPFDVILEKDFFFNMQKDGNFQYWSEKDYKSTNRYKGGFAYYFRYMMGGGNNANGKNDESSMTTLLPKYYGLFAFQEKGDSPNLITIQNGIFPSVLPNINYKFDLKGSSNNRFLPIEEAEKKESIWMDLNFIEHKQKNSHGFFRNGIQISTENWQKIQKVLEADSKFLASHNIVDYSLLLGVHFVDNENGAANAENKEKLKHGIPAHCINCSSDPKIWKKPVKMLKQKSKIGQMDGNIEDGGYLSKSDSDTESIHDDEDWEIRREIRIYIGIIDILQAYNGAKWAESLYKNTSNTIGKIMRLTLSKVENPPSVFSQNYDPSKDEKKLNQHSPITIIEPPKYQKRFVDFLTMVVFKQENLNL